MAIERRNAASTAFESSGRVTSASQPAKELGVTGGCISKWGGL